MRLSAFFIPFLFLDRIDRLAGSLQLSTVFRANLNSTRGIGG